MTIKKTLITGSRGYVASFFIKKYKNRLNLCTLRKKLKDIDVLKKEHELENVIHFASINKFPQFNKNSKKNFKKNIEMFDEIFRHKNKKINNFFFTSTIDCGKKIFPNYKKMYVASKLLIENKLRIYFKKNEIRKVIILRLPSILNPKSKIFINKLISNIKKNQDVKLSEVPRKFNSITTKEDISDFLYESLKNKKKGFYLLNFCCNKPIFFQNLFKIIKKNYNSKSNLYAKKITNKKPIECKKISKNFNFKLTSVKKAVSNYMEIT